MPEKNAGQRFYYPQLDGLRFFAFLLVFIHNAPHLESVAIWKSLHEYGWIGVDIFFCLSAYLITKLLVAEYKEFGNINIQNFYTRRILRIFPLYFFYMIFATVYVLLTQGWDFVIIKHLSGLFSFTYNFVYLLLTEKIYIVFAHLWTIAYEIQFYITIPWILILINNKKERMKVFLAFVFLTGTLLRILLIYYKSEHPVIYMLPFTHFEALMFGICIGTGIFANHLKKIRADYLLVIGLLIGLTVFLLKNINQIGWHLMLTYPLTGLSTGLIVLSFTKNSQSLFINILRMDFIVYLGKISYGLYIFHIISISAVDKIYRNIYNTSFEQNLFFILSSSFLLTVLISILSYYLLESPFLKSKERFKENNVYRIK